MYVLLSLIIVGTDQLCVGSAFAANRGCYCVEQVSSLQDNAGMSTSKEAVLQRVNAIESGDASVVLLDSLPSASYEGTGRSKAGRRPGHITGAVSLPYTTLFDGETGLFLPAKTLRQAFADVGITHGVPVLAY